MSNADPDKDEERAEPFRLYHRDRAIGSVGRSGAVAAISDIPTEEVAGRQGAMPTGYVGLSVSSGRIFGAFLLALAFVLVIVFRTGQLQVAQGGYYIGLAEGNRSRIELIPAERGVMYDRNGIQLVRNIPTFTAKITPSDLPQDESGGREVIQKVAEILGVPPLDIELRLSEYGRYSTAAVAVSDELTHEQAILLKIESVKYPAVEVGTEMRREYLHTDSVGSLSHILGYQGRISPDELGAAEGKDYLPTDFIGKAGLEGYYEQALRGSYGRRRIEIDALGQEKTVIAEEDGMAGTNMVLAVDIDIQEAVEDILDAHLKSLGKRRASAIVMKPDTGEILAMVSTPYFDSNQFAQGISWEAFGLLSEDADNPMFPRAVSASMASGSPFKMVVGAAALDEGIAKPSTSFNSTGGIQIGQWFFPDWKYGGHGWTDLKKAFAESVNTYFYIVGGGHEDREGLGVDRINEYARRFGFGDRLGVDLPGEGSGFLPTREWKKATKGERWYIGDTYHLSIGQGDILVTPLQVAAMTTVFANGGELVRPKVVNAFITPDGQRIAIGADVIKAGVVSGEAVESVRRGLRSAVTVGSAKSLGALPYRIAGKTGTAQWSSSKKPHAWFTSFAPYEEPEIVVTIAVEEGGEGSAVAAPIAADIYAWYFRNRPSS